ncbi:uncharacterized protein [Halyomorpha halys]|uniref:uncharacterized protein n=1 Tax=Halyomorpha halys TaxID=286706 RepID=UPI0006D4D4DE
MEQELSRALNNAEHLSVIRFTRHLSLIANNNQNDPEPKPEGEETTLERLERYLYGHSLRLELPEELVEGARGLIPSSFLSQLPTSLTVPLAQEESPEGRGMIKKLVMPFLLGLKFKATAVMPIAIALIALKTWKAFTLGLLSIVLSAALVIFRLTRPKVLNYEVVVPPAHTHHHIVDEHYQARAANDLAYSAHRR